ncbi:FAD-dependent monooxygenase [Actinomadura oligospora]|uniref:FAD-dependent monooxygenase n=1 Tax=Actinomadura oligospora TaxID=111804 RepID=UPI00047DD8A6|nr:FAD-dependent monooxygenase [Actinomadura oligospora]
MILVAGAGTVGLSTALFLAHHGADVMVVERREGPDVHPRATGVGPRTLELFREVGIEDAVNAAAIPMTSGLGKITTTNLAAADMDALAAAAPPRPVQMTERFGDFSPAALRGTCPQDRLDRVLLDALRQRGVTVSYSTPLISFTQDATGVTAVLPGQTVRADYLVAADGARSGVRDALGIGVSGPGALGDALTNILFEADLTPYTRGHSFVTCNTDTGMLVTIDGTRTWVLHVRHEDGMTEARCRDLVRSAVGDPGLDVTVRGAARWRVRGQLADRFQDGRVFLVGDAAHTVPPVGAFGMNTGVADAHNLAWKLAAVLDGTAAPDLLDTYEAERRPVAALTLEQALLRLADPRLHWGTGPEAAAARAAAGAVHAPVVHLGYRYDSSAIIDARPGLPSAEDLVLDGAPGSRVPHAWVADGVSTLDLVASRFTVFTRSPSWVASAEAAGLPAHLVDAAHLNVDWIPEDGLLLVRPDGFVALRTSDPSTDLRKAMHQLLMG